jgi:hypothetical protein
MWSGDGLSGMTKFYRLCHWDHLEILDKLLDYGSRIREEADGLQGQTKFRSDKKFS